MGTSSDFCQSQWQRILLLVSDRLLLVLANMAYSIEDFVNVKRKKKLKSVGMYLSLLNYSWEVRTWL